MNQKFLIRCARKYKTCSRQTQKDAVLYAIGAHAGILDRTRCPMPTLTEEERILVKDFVNKFFCEKLLLD